MSRLILIAPFIALASAFPLDTSLHGFLDARVGSRLNDDPGQHNTSIAESRLQLESETFTELATFQLRADFIADALNNDPGDVDLQTGNGWLDLREAYALFSPTDGLDVKVGRQTLTWGTGDLIFINDLFPKDYVSFFTGREDAYLKAPSDAIMFSAFPALANIDVVYTPQFDPDRFLDGDRVSFFPGTFNRRNRLPVDVPDRVGDDDEWAVRIGRTLGTTEAALYFYDGFWKSPAGFDPERTRYTFPRLRVWGASLRGVLAGGIGNLETGYYDSMADQQGRDPFTPNSQWRMLAGFERELFPDFTLGLQYSAEWMQDHEAYRDSLPENTPGADEVRHVLTTRLTQRIFNQNGALSLFVFVSPSDEDLYLRPQASHAFNDHWQGTLGANLFFGREDHTFFGQLEQNNNVYASVRYSF
jgi:hypothetical protein